MAIRSWHPGKLFIIWAWGGLIAAIVLTDFLSRPVRFAPLSGLLEMLFVIFVLVLLSGITWHWFGGKEKS